MTSRKDCFADVEQGCGFEGAGACLVESWGNYLPLNVVGIARRLDLLTAGVTTERYEAMGQAVHALKPGLQPTDFAPGH
jgi:hypothetical protein